ncbi:SMP-30/gluconolactonase/LRE family protein [Aliikangiella sp. IMCC44359]|uniref:SMP-30/gluconolactonase/LRE family protein n=1 Tax=Aliikangiella sp. IMCC44359 TaxID=3459125 RepID=UPI00403AD0C5
MIGSSKVVYAELFSRLPTQYHYQGKPTNWVKTTRPGQNLHSFLEGPIYDKQKNLWLVDVPYGRIFCVSPDGHWQLNYQYNGEPHGLANHPDNGFILTDYQRGLLHFNPQNKKEKLSVICHQYNTENFRGLSDLCVARNGDIWFSDSGRSSLSDASGRLFCLKNSGQLELILNNIPYPNGIALSPDNQQIYLAVTRANAVWKLLAEAPKSLMPMTGCYIQLSGGLGPDGLAINQQGLLAVAHAQAGRAWLFDPIGDLIAQIKMPEGLWTTSLAFSGEQEQILSIVEAQTGSIYQIDIKNL